MGFTKLGSTRVLKYFSGQGWHRGTVMSFCRPHFPIKYRDGDTESLLGCQLAAVLHVNATCFTVISADKSAVPCAPPSHPARTPIRVPATFGA